MTDQPAASQDRAQGHPILEHLVLDVTDGPAFETAFATAIRHVTGSPGCRGAELRRCVEVEGRYLLLIGWETLEDHTEGFRGSPAFPAWRAEVGGYFAAAPTVEHYEPV